MEKIYRYCPICDSRHIKNIKRISFEMECIMPDFYFLAKCNNCGFIYANTIATKDDYDRYYSENNRYSHLPSQSSSSLEIYEKVCKLIKKYVNKDEKILDVGCGSGDMLKLLKLDGYKHLTGLDPSKMSIDKLLDAGIFGIKGSIYDKPSGDMYGKFDIIILSGVLEHLYDLKNSIENLRKYLNRSGKILCIIPNSLEYYLYPLPLPHYINIEHINHFSPNSLISLFSASGFSLLECYSVAMHFGRVPDPALLAVFEYTNVEDITNQKICEMILKDELQQNKIDAIVDDLVDEGKKIAVFGTGNFARTLMANTNLNNANIICFLDNDLTMQGAKFCGYEVNPPTFLYDFKGEVLILSMCGAEEIKKQIIDMGVDNKLIIL